MQKRPLLVVALLLRVEHAVAVMMDRTAVQAVVFALVSKVDRCLFTDVLHVAASPIAPSR